MYSLRRITSLLCSTLLLSFSLTATAITLDDGLIITITTPATCPRPATANDRVSVHYTGTLADGTVFDSSHRRNAPITFTLGVGQVITGWDEGLVGMCIGEARNLTIPAELAYGSRGVGAIPPNSVLYFSTELMGIEGVEADASIVGEEQGTVDEGAKAAAASVTQAALESASAVLAQATGAEAAAAGPTTTAVMESFMKTTVSQAVPTFKSTIPVDEQISDEAIAAAAGGHSPGTGNNGECRLLGPFALIVQGGLGLLAILILVWKRFRERPQRPLKIWFFDASKQVFGSALLHVANLFMSMLSSGGLELSTTHVVTTQVSDSQGRTPNPCSFYLVNLAIDTTIGIPILVVLLRLLTHVARRTPLARPTESVESGHYGSPPRATWWLKQSVIYFIGLLLMKLCVYGIFEILPWIAWVGDWALRWTEGSEALQIAFVMFVFPVVMNAIQYYIIDSFIKGKPTAEHERVPGEDPDADGEDGDHEDGVAGGGRYDEDARERERERGTARSFSSGNSSVDPEARKRSPITITKVQGKGKGFEA